MSSGLDEQDVERILDAVETIEACLGRLVETRNELDRKAYKNDADVQAIVERRFVTMTEAALDIGEVILVSDRGAPADSNSATMRHLGELGVLSEEGTRKMEDAARFRNVLAHTYGDAIDHDVVYDALGDLERYREYVAAVRDYLDDVGALE